MHASPPFLCFVGIESSGQGEVSARLGKLIIGRDKIKKLNNKS